MELFQKGTIRLGSNQMINYVDSCGKEDLDIVIAGYRGDLERPQEPQKAVIETDQPAKR
ncbi:MAG: hypothetical protein KAU41_02275 [Deltaproteobacteria bacterium]|jgi:hypothetical protein|nr:hypothetical protein [Deltaproteobacteria bacterium]